MPTDGAIEIVVDGPPESTTKITLPLLPIEGRSVTVKNEGQGEVEVRTTRALVAFDGSPIDTILTIPAGMTVSGYEGIHPVPRQRDSSLFGHACRHVDGNPLNNAPANLDVDRCSPPEGEENPDPERLAWMCYFPLTAMCGWTSVAKRSEVGRS